MDYIVLGQGFGVRFEGAHLRWIYWAPGRKAQEGLLTWGKETQGVVPWNEGQPRYMHRPDAEIVADLMSVGILDQLKTLVRLRTEPAADIALAQVLAANCPHYQSAMLLAKGPIRPGWESSLHGFYRHHCCSYDSALKKCADRLTETLKAHNELIEIMQFIKAHSQEILDCPQTSTALEWFVKLAELDHDAVINSALLETASRR